MFNLRVHCEDAIRVDTFVSCFEGRNGRAMRRRLLSSFEDTPAFENALCVWRISFDVPRQALL